MATTTTSTDADTTPTEVAVNVKSGSQTKYVEPVGIVDADGVLWKASKVGSFTCTVPGIETAWAALEKRCTDTPDKRLVGKRPILTRELEDGKFEKFTLGEYQYLTCKQYFDRVTNAAAGLQDLAGAELSTNKYAPKRHRD